MKKVYAFEIISTLIKSFQTPQYLLKSVFGVVSFRDVVRTPETCNLESFAIIVNKFQPLTINEKFSFLDVFGSPGYPS